jgi:hypothetical protein
VIFAVVDENITGSQEDRYRMKDSKLSGINLKIDTRFPPARE